ncbi:MAG: hypothetical protein U0586_02925 [Candidatus Brocadiaceae bacterium]
MTRTMRFDGTLLLVVVHGTLSLQRETPYSVITSKAKQSFSHRQTVPFNKGNTFYYVY